MSLLPGDHPPGEAACPPPAPPAREGPVVVMVVWGLLGSRGLWILPWADPNLTRRNPWEGWAARRNVP